MAQQPLINPLFPEWDWHGSNGQATAEETQRAEIALLNKGRVSRFIPIVWNDLVNKVYQLKTEIGDKWIEGYATYQNTLIPDGIYDITANAFNALVQNIKHGSEIADDEYSDLADVDFGWATDDMFPGYIGREVVYGLSQAGAEADTVYGSYFIETVRKLNYCISLFKHYYKGYAESTFAVQNDTSAIIHPGTNDDATTTFAINGRQYGATGGGENAWVQNSLGLDNANDGVGATGYNAEHLSEFGLEHNTDGINAVGKNDIVVSKFAIGLDETTHANSGHGENAKSSNDIYVDNDTKANIGDGKNVNLSDSFFGNGIANAQMADGKNSTSRTQFFGQNMFYANSVQADNANLQSQSYGQQKTFGTSGGIWHYQDGDTLYIKKSESATVVDNVLRLW